MEVIRHMLISEHNHDFMGWYEKITSYYNLHEGLCSITIKKKKITQRVKWNHQSSPFNLFFKSNQTVCQHDGRGRQ